MPTWERVDELRDRASLVVVDRPGVSVDLPEGWDFQHVEVPRLEISSTELRARVVDGRPLDYLVPPGAVACLHRSAASIVRPAHDLRPRRRLPPWRSPRDRPDRTGRSVGHRPRRGGRIRTTAGLPRPARGAHAARGRRARSRWWRYGFPIALVLLVAAVPVLVYAGMQVVLKSNDGRLIPATADPSSPGWEATVPPTPTMALATLNDGGGLSSVALLALTADKEGAVVLIPVDTQVTVGTTPQTLVEAYEAGGQARLKAALESLTGTGIDQVSLVNGRNWQDLVTPAGNLTFDNPDNVIINGAMLFPQGPLTLTPDHGRRLHRVAELGRGRHEPPPAPRAVLAGVAGQDRRRSRHAGRARRDRHGHRALRRHPGPRAGELSPSCRCRSTRSTTAYAGVYLPLPEAKQLDRPGDPVPDRAGRRRASPHPRARRHGQARSRPGGRAQPGRLGRRADRQHRQRGQLPRTAHRVHRRLRERARRRPEAARRASGSERSSSTRAPTTRSTSPWCSVRTRSASPRR